IRATSTNGWCGTSCGTRTGPRYGRGCTSPRPRSPRGCGAGATGSRAATGGTGGGTRHLGSADPARPARPGASGASCGGPVRPPCAGLLDAAPQVQAAQSEGSGREEPRPGDDVLPLGALEVPLLRVAPGLPGVAVRVARLAGAHPRGVFLPVRADVDAGAPDFGGAPVVQHPPAGLDEPVRRSEEHTSELQSRENLVCRLLLEKK